MKSDLSLKTAESEAGSALKIGPRKRELNIKQLVSKKTSSKIF